MDSPFRQPPESPRDPFIQPLSWRQREYRMWALFVPIGFIVLLCVAYQTGLLSQIIQGDHPLHPEIERADAIDTRLTPEADDVPPASPPEAIVNASKTSAASNSSEIDMHELQKLDFSIVRQDAGFLTEERQLWGSVLNAFQNMDDKKMSLASVGVVRFSQLYRQSEAYCGKVVTVKGELNRVEKGKPFVAGSQLTPTFRCWIRPDSENDPLALDVLDLPPPLKTQIGKDHGGALKFSIQAHGVFLKRLAYRSRSGPRVAPLLLCKTLAVIPQVSTATQEGRLDWLPATIAAAAFLAIIAITWIDWRTQRPHPRKRDITRIFILGAILHALGSINYAQESAPISSSDGDPIATVEQKPTLEDYLQLMDFTTDDWVRLLSWNTPPHGDAEHDGDPLDLETLRSLGKVADLLDRIPQQDFAAWLRSNSANMSTPHTEGSVQRSFTLRTGFVTKIRRHGGSRGKRRAIAEHQIDGESEPILWECLLHSPTTPEDSLTCFVRNVPPSWQTVFFADPKIADTSPREEQPDSNNWFVLHEPISVEGLFLSSTADTSLANATKAARSLLIAPKIHWYPQRPNPRMQIAESHCLLASAGFDVASLESVSPRGPLTVEDREPFYQLLATVPKIGPHRLQQAREKTVPLSLLLQDGGHYRGRIFSFEGTARRAIEIIVDSPDIQERFAIRRYFEVEVFVEPDVRIQVVHPETGETKAFSRYPIVFCCKDWPANAPIGDAIHVPVSITGVYLKQWTYRSKFMDEGWSDGNRRVQWSPLLLAAGATIIQPPANQSDPLGTLSGTIIVASIVLIAISAIWMSLPNRRR